MKISIERIFQTKGIPSAKPESFGSLTCTKTNKEPSVSGAEWEGKRMDEAERQKVAK